MFTLDATIDAVQTGKKQFVKTFVQNEKIADAMNTFIDEQASYTKKAAKVGTDTFATLTSEMVNKWWAKSIVAIILCVIGWYIGGVQTESRIASDCKFAGAFRVDIQAFTCQRRL